MIPVTREMFDKVGPFYLDDFPVDNQDDQDRMFELFKELPMHIQSIAVMWGCNDTVFRDEAFVFLLYKYYRCSPEEFYSSNNAMDATNVITLSLNKKIKSYWNQQEIECPNCNHEFIAKVYYNGECSKCGKKYIWDSACCGTEDEYDFVDWEG